MKILGMGMPELLIILAVILLIFGPKNLPKLGASLGKTVRGLREGLGGDKKVEAEEEVAEIEETEDVEDVKDQPARVTVKKAKKTTETV